MNLDFTVDARDLQKLGGKLDKAAKQLATELAQAQVVNIRLRVDEGFGLDDKKMPGYAESTKKDRQRRGRQTATRKLQDTGSMLRSMQAESAIEVDGGYQATINFATRKDAEVAAYQQQRTPWFGFSANDEAQLSAIAEQRLKEIADEL